MGGIVRFDQMGVGKKGGGKHWTKKEVEARTKAAQKTIRKKRTNLRMPGWLGEDAQAIWKKTIRDMKGLDILDRVDEDLLATYCDAVARYREATQRVADEGFTTHSAQGGLTVSPYVRAAQSYARIMMQYADKLGLSPNSRARLAKKIADEEADANADLFE